MFCFTLLCVRSSIAIILMRKRELVALLNLSPWCLVIVERLFLAVPRGCLRFVIVVFPDHTHLLFLVPLKCCRQTDRRTEGWTDGRTDGVDPLLDWSYRLHKLGTPLVLWTDRRTNGVDLLLDLP